MEFKTKRHSDFFSIEALESIVEDAIDNNASDIHVNVDDYIRFEINGRYIIGSNQKLDSMEVVYIANNLYKSETGSELVLSGKSNDHEYEYRYKKEGADAYLTYMFRVNSSAATVSGRLGISITIRLLNEEPPIWNHMGYGEALWDMWRPSEGLVVVSGPTGTGKSTLLASGLRRILEESSNEKIITLESPIEYILAPYQKEDTLVVQRSVPKNCHTFVQGVEDSLRQHPTIVVVGESRRKEEIDAALLVCQTGHLTYTTTHTNSVPETMFRMVSNYTPTEQQSKLADIVYSSRLFVNQRLLLSNDGKRVAIREVLNFDNDVRRQLEQTKPRDIKRIMRTLINEHGQSFSKHAESHFKNGLISEKTLKRIQANEINELKDGY